MAGGGALGVPLAVLVVPTLGVLPGMLDGLACLGLGGVGTHDIGVLTARLVALDGLGVDVVPVGHEKFPSCQARIEWGSRAGAA